MDLLGLKKKLKDLSIDDLESILFHHSDSLGYLHPHQMSELGVDVNIPLFVSDFLDLFQFSLLKL